MAGFGDIDIKFSSPVPEEHRLRRIEAEASDEKERHMIAVYNDNIDRLNGMLFGAQEYAVIGKK